MNERRKTNRSSSSGFIIVAVLWILIALAGLVSIYSMYVANAATALAVNDDRLQAEQLVAAALELTAYRLSSPVKEKRPTSGAFAFRLGTATVRVAFVSEAARIDLNLASKEVLAGLFVVLGAKPDNASQFADRIIGWRTAPKPDAQEDEEAVYRAAGLRYGPRGAPFAHISELWLVAGMPPALVERALPFLTVYSGRQEVNFLDAAPEVIAALPGMTSMRLNTFMQRRETPGAANGFGADALGDAEKNITDKGSDAIRVTAQINFSNGWRTVSQVVILLGGGDDPFRVLSWRDDVDTATAAVAEMGRW